MITERVRYRKNWGQKELCAEKKWESVTSVKFTPVFTPLFTPLFTPCYGTASAGWELVKWQVRHSSSTVQEHNVQCHGPANGSWHLPQV
jgi:hypothetical protein